MCLETHRIANARHNVKSVIFHKKAILHYEYLYICVGFALVCVGDL